MFAPPKLIGLGLLLVVLGVVGPFLMVLQVVESTFWLSFLSYGASTMGLFLGLIGAAFYARLHVRDQDEN